jgi:hypothetical protein
MTFADMPVIWANYVSMAGFVFLGVVVWLIPKKLIFAEAQDQSRWRDIRLWATALIGLQLTIYALFN